MPIQDLLPELRKAANMTQADLAARLYVTRQAVSRWETGETTPSIDMVKLISSVLDVPVLKLLEIPDEPVCQSCGTAFSAPGTEHGKDSDGKPDSDYCQWCYNCGSFTQECMYELIESTAPFFAEATGVSVEVAISYLGAFIPSLKRWHQQQQHHENRQESNYQKDCKDC